MASDEQFVNIWREGLLAHAWHRLEEDQNNRGHIYYSLLRLRVDHPDWSSEQLIAAAGKETGREMAEGSLRVTLHRARRRFADFLLDAVGQSGFVKVFHHCHLSSLSIQLLLPFALAQLT